VSLCFFEGCPDFELQSDEREQMIFLHGIRVYNRA